MPQDSNTKDFNDSSPAATPGNPEVAKAKDALMEGASHLKDDVKHAAGEAASQAKELAESKFDVGRDFAAEHLDSVASALRKAGEELRSNDSPVTDYVTKAAGAVDHVSYYLQTRTLSHIMTDLESFSRREPAMFLGGAFVAGILGGRFLKSATPAGASRRDPPRPVRALPAYTAPRDQNNEGERETLPGGGRPDASAGRGSYGAATSGTPTSGASTTKASPTAPAPNQTTPAKAPTVKNGEARAADGAHPGARG